MAVRWRDSAVEIDTRAMACSAGAGMTSQNPSVPRSQAEAARLQHEPRILALPGVTGFDLIGTADDARFVVYVADLTQLDPELRGLSELDGVPVEVVERRYTLH